MPLSLEQTRYAVLARMVRKSPDQTLGRTQVMKLFYFLQELKGGQLGYDFRLFTYGPFDSEVLSDLSSACSLGMVTEKTIIYPRGYGYNISLGDMSEVLDQVLETECPALVSSADEIVQEFGSLSAAELELRSTILYVDREFVTANQHATLDEISARVRQIKPHFTLEMINDRTTTMQIKGFLLAIAA